jgi:hypothetical protein
VTHLNRWKLATVLLAVATAVATVKAVTAGDRATGRAKPTVAATTSRASLPSNLRRPLRVSAAAVGISERDLIDRILASRSVSEIQVLTAKLGPVALATATPARSAIS